MLHAIEWWVAIYSEWHPNTLCRQWCPTQQCKAKTFVLQSTKPQWLGEKPNLILSLLWGVIGNGSLQFCCLFRPQLHYHITVAQRATCNGVMGCHSFWMAPQYTLLAMVPCKTVQSKNVCALTHHASVIRCKAYLILLLSCSEERKNWFS